ncbi:MAG: ArnT family glycosyltransferase [Blastocatellia bacterium]
MRQHVAFILVLLLLAATFLATGAGPALADYDESLQAMAAREMLARRDWVIPHVNGIPGAGHAPLLSWLTAACMLIFGADPLAVRLPVMLASIALLWLIWLSGRRAYSAQVGLYAAMILSSCAGTFVFTRGLSQGPVLALWLALASYCFWRGFFGAGHEKKFHYGFYAALALAALTAGLTGVLLIVAPLFFFLLLTGNVRQVRHMRPLTGALLFLALAAPWHILAYLRNPGFAGTYLSGGQLRDLSQTPPDSGPRLPFWLYWLLPAVWLFPWSVGLPLGFPHEISPFWRQMDRRAMSNLYLWLQALFILLWCSLPASRAGGAFPAYGALALLIAAGMQSAEERALGRRLLLFAHGALALIGAVAALALLTLLWQTRNRAAAGIISSVPDAGPGDPAGQAGTLLSFPDLSPEALMTLRGPALCAAVAIGLGFAIAFWFRWRGAHTQASAALTLTMLVLFLCAGRAHIALEPLFSSRRFAEAILNRQDTNARIVLDHSLDAGASIAWYTGRQVMLYDARRGSMRFSAQLAPAAAVFIDDAASLRRLWNGPQRVFLFLGNERRDKLKRDLNAPVYTLEEKAGKTVLMNKP